MQRARALVWPIGLRLLACLVQAVFLHNSLLRYAEEPRRITLLFLITSEIATFLGLLLSRWAKQTDYPPLALAMVASAYSYTILLDATAGISLIPEPVGAVVQIVAICWTIFAKASLGRSFGLLPANRGVVVRGAYRWVRHPICRVAVHPPRLPGGEFRLAQPGRAVAALFHPDWPPTAGGEFVVRQHGRYRSYTAGVRYHLLPGVF